MPITINALKAVGPESMASQLVPGLGYRQPDYERGHFYDGAKQIAQNIEADDTDFNANTNTFFFDADFGVYVHEIQYNFEGSSNEDLSLSGIFFDGRQFNDRSLDVVTTLTFGSGTSHDAGPLPSLLVQDTGLIFEWFIVAPGAGFESMVWSGANFNAGQLFAAMQSYEAGNHLPLSSCSMTRNTSSTAALLTMYSLVGVLTTGSPVDKARTH